jgi:aspartyl-tRNA(Asn)/glutamyl-tRNA(Gln) amidotransferase subunit A
MDDGGNKRAFRTIEQIQFDIAAGRANADDIVKAAQVRARKLDCRLHAFIEWFSESDTKSARSPRCGGVESKGVLHGVPIAIKDLFDYAGALTRAGSTVLPEIPAAKTATAVRRLEAAGAVILGKTHTVEFAFGGWGTNPIAGTPWNPWDMHTHRVPGGSSSGSAVAVAAGMAVAALGTDTGGSIRTPASYCGIVGFKPSPGLVSRAGVFPLCKTHDTVGVLTRTVRDAAIMLSVISGPDPEDEVTLHAPHVDFLVEIEDGLRGLRLGVLPESELAAANDEVRRLYNDTLAAITQAGARPKEFIQPRPLVDYLRIGGEIMGVESYVNLAPYVDPEDSKVDPVIRSRVLKGREISTEGYLEIITERHRAKREFLDRLEGIDALIMPTCVEDAIPVSAVDENRIVTPYGRFVNLLDLTALSVPMGLTTDSLPAGLQIVARQFDDALALRIARAVEGLCGTFQPIGL